MAADERSFRQLLPGFMIPAGTQVVLAELEAELDQAFADSRLPEDRHRTAVHEFLVDLRLSGI